MGRDQRAVENIVGHCGRLEDLPVRLRERYDAAMSQRWIQSMVLLPLLAGCTGIHSIEILDEKTGMTAGALDKPVAFMETGIFDLVDPTPKQATIAYLGPVEWDRSGELTYVLWLQIAPGVGGHRIDDITLRGAVDLELDDGPMVLSVMDFSKASSPYRPILPIGQTAYFQLDATLLKRMAASRKMVLNLRASDLTRVDFVPIDPPRVALEQFIHDRDIGGE